jgi:CHASE2 domain-containing sensor protein/two-component sensor histidine kinase
LSCKNQKKTVLDLMRIKKNVGWLQIRQKTKVWRDGALPGVIVISCVVIARSFGALQTLEWIAFDYLLQQRPIEATDSRITIVGINEADIRAVGNYPIPDRDLAKLLKTLNTYQPRAIGLDIFRDLKTDPNQNELAEVLRNTPNLIGIETALSPDPTLQVKPPPEVPLDRVGLADAILDPDGKLRRNLLATKVDSGEIRYSLALLLAKTYLASEGIPLQHGSRASDPIRFGAVTVPRFRANTGGYVGALAGGNQTLLNFRNNSEAFSTVSMREVLAGKVQPDLLRDRVILIGMTATSVNDTFLTSATRGTLLTDVSAQASSDQYQLIYGVEIQAHATSQLISAVLDRRQLLRSWFESWEYFWIIAWGVSGIAAGLLLQSSWKTLLLLASGSITLVTICYGILVLGWWIPFVPALLAFGGAGLTTALFDRTSRLLLDQRNLILKRTYDAVHSGPLQTLAAMLRSMDDEMLSIDQLRSKLQGLNQELRSIYEPVNQALIGDELYETTAIETLLYQIYESTLNRNLPGFATIKTFISPNFSALSQATLTAAQKQGLCIFLEEALCNVGKHAIEARRLEVNCTREEQQYCLQIIDDGSGRSSAFKNLSGGRGTAQAKELARSLGGKFQRRSREPRGTICELTWSVTKKRWWG